MKKLPINQQLCYLRTKNGFTQQEIVNVLHIDRSTYSYYECGKTTPDIHTLCILSDFFHISLDELVQRSSLH